MTPRERLKAAMQRRQPDRVPVWCPLSLEHIILNGTETGQVPGSIDEFVRAECALTRRYHFDGVVLYLPGCREGTRADETIRNWLNVPPAGDSTHEFANTDPDAWERETSDYQPEDFYSGRLAREILGPDYHIGGWTPDGFSRAVQWFPKLDDALVATLEDPGRFRALVNYFDEQSVAWAKAQVEFGGMESIHISSPYAGSSFLSRKAYENLVLPSVRKLAEALRPLPAFSYLHTCGFLSDRLELVAQAGIDGLECMDPPPLGDVELADAKRRVGDRIFLKGNIDSVNVLLLGKDEEVERAVRKCLDAGMPGGGYILSTACSVAPAVAPERVERLAALAERFGTYD